MTIYRGIGGGGDATSDIEVNLLSTLAQTSTNAATAASSSAADAAASATSAATSATNAATSASSAAASAAVASALTGTVPSQTGNAGKFLTTNGTNISYADVPTGFKNRIINGGMVIDQRNAGAAITVPSNSRAYPVDRFYGGATTASKFTLQQNAGSVVAPVGFTNYLGATVGASANVTVGANDAYYISQTIEYSNISDLAWGTANAATVTLSFRVYSSLTGTFGGSIVNLPYGESAFRSYPFNYTISAANTWTTVSVTIPGDNNAYWVSSSYGLFIVFSLGIGLTSTANSWTAGGYFSASGSVKVIETNGATFYITGVQLEKGSTATSFDFRSDGTELALCQRYLPVLEITTAALSVPGACSSTTNGQFAIPFSVKARTAPTGISYTLGGSVANYGGAGKALTNITFSFGTVDFAVIVGTVASGLTSGAACVGALPKIVFTGCEI